jgi:hypothetical protein
MRKFPAVVVALLLIAMASGGCYYDNEETLYPPQGCDTVNVKYSDQVNAIFVNKCFDCHSNNNAALYGDDQSWEGYANVYDYLVVPNQKLYFLQAINHDINATPMPKNRPKLSDCEIRTFELWIADGFPNN